MQILKCQYVGPIYWYVFERNRESRAANKIKEVRSLRTQYRMTLPTSKKPDTFVS